MIDVVPCPIAALKSKQDDKNAKSLSKRSIYTWYFLPPATITKHSCLRLRTIHVSLFFFTCKIKLNFRITLLASIVENTRKCSITRACSADACETFAKERAPHIRRMVSHVTKLSRLVHGSRSIFIAVTRPLEFLARGEPWPRSFAIKKNDGWPRKVTVSTSFPALVNNLGNVWRMVGRGQDERSFSYKDIRSKCFANLLEKAISSSTWNEIDPYQNYLSACL